MILHLSCCFHAGTLKCQTRVKKKKAKAIQDWVGSSQLFPRICFCTDIHFMLNFILQKSILEKNLSVNGIPNIIGIYCTPSDGPAGNAMEMIGAENRRTHIAHILKGDGITPSDKKQVQPTSLGPVKHSDHSQNLFIKE